MQVKGENYLVPVSANITSEDEADLEARVARRVVQDREREREVGLRIEADELPGGALLSGTFGVRAEAEPLDDLDGVATVDARDLARERLRARRRVEGGRRGAGWHLDMVAGGEVIGPALERRDAVSSLDGAS